MDDMQEVHNKDSKRQFSLIQKDTFQNFHLGANHGGISGTY